MKTCFFSFCLLQLLGVSAQPVTDCLPSGRAYYSDCMPHDRPGREVRLREEAGCNMSGTAYSTEELEDSVFDFSLTDCVWKAMDGAGIKTITDMPTDAVPAWQVTNYTGQVVMSPSPITLYCCKAPASQRGAQGANNDFLTR